MYPSLPAPHLQSHPSSSSSSSYPYTLYSAPPSPTSTRQTRILPPYTYHNNNRTVNNPYSAMANLHHLQTHAHLYPSGSSSGGNPGTSSSEGAGAGAVGAAVGTSASNSPSMRPSTGHGYHAHQSHHLSNQHGQQGPALQVTHPNADIYRARSASPWVPPQSQSQPHYGSLSSIMGGGGLHGGGGIGGTSSSTAANSSSLIHQSNTSSSSAYQTHYPYTSSLSNSSYAPHSSSAGTGGAYAFPSHSSSDYANNGNMASYGLSDTRHTSSKEYPHSLVSHSNLTSHLLPSVKTEDYSNNINNSDNYNNNNNAFQDSKPTFFPPFGNPHHRLLHDHNASASSHMMLKSHSEQGSTRSVSSSAATRKQITSAAAASSQQQRSFSSGNNANADAAVGQATTSVQSAHPVNNYGILDETNTSLWDLKDGPDGRLGKPPYPYLTLIRIALLSSPTKRMTLQELYDVLEERYPFFMGESKGWKNSIRHNLSLNKCFKKETRHVLDPGKGSYWYVDLSEEHSTPRIRNRRKDANGNLITGSGSGGGSGGGSKSKKRKVEGSFSNDSGDAEGSDGGNYHQPDGYDGSSSYFEEENLRSFKLRVGDLRFPYSLSITGPSGRGASGGGAGAYANTGGAGAQRGRTRAISAPSPVTSTFFASGMSMYNNHQAGGSAVSSTGQQGQEQSYSDDLPAPGSGLGPTFYTFPPMPPAQQRYVLDPFHRVAGGSAGYGNSQHSHGVHPHQQQHHPMSVPSMMADTVPTSGGTESTFALETPKTGFPGNAATTSIGSTNKTQNDSTSLKIKLPAMPRVTERAMSDEEARTRIEPQTHHANANANDDGRGGSDDDGSDREGNDSSGPGPASTYVFPPPPIPSSMPGQTNRIFVHPPGTANTILKMTNKNSLNLSNNINSHHEGVQGNASIPSADNYSNSNNNNNNNNNNNAHNGNSLGNAYNCNLSNARSVSNPISTSNPFAPVPPPHAAHARPAPLQLNQLKDGRNVFSPPSASATSPTRHLQPNGFEDLFSSAPFGVLLDNPDRRQTRSGSIFGLTAR